MYAYDEAEYGDPLFLDTKPELYMDDSPPAEMLYNEFNFYDSPFESSPYGADLADIGEYFNPEDDPANNIDLSYSDYSPAGNYELELYERPEPPMPEYFDQPFTYEADEADLVYFEEVEPIIDDYVDEIYYEEQATVPVVYYEEKVPEYYEKPVYYEEKPTQAPITDYYDPEPIYYPEPPTAPEYTQDYEPSSFDYSGVFDQIRDTYKPPVEEKPIATYE